MAYQDIYTTQAGDMWDLISYKVYGTEKYLPQLLAANQDCKETVVFEGGVEIVCPDIDVRPSSSLPSWV